MTTSQANLSPESPKPIKPVLRIDAAHRKVNSAKSESDAPVLAATVAGEGSVRSAGESTEQVQLQASQLAKHLQDRRQDMDHRESQLNARIAQLENELRLSRLWLREQNEEFTQREVEVRQQLSEQESRLAAAAAAELALNESRRQFAEESRRREDLLARRELQVDESQKRLAQEATRLQSIREQLELDRQQLQQEQSEQHSRNSIADLEQLARIHQQQVDEWKQERAQLQQQAQHRQRELEMDQEALSVRCRRWMEEREQEQLALERDRKHLDQRQATLERIRSDVLRLHREALEMRLVTEQLWAQFAGRFSPAELTARVSKLRNQLADEFRFANQELEQQRTSLQELILRLDAKQKELTEQRNELLAWFRRRQADLAQKAVELSQRNQRLIAERQQLRDEQIDQQESRFAAMAMRQSEPI